MLPLGIQWGWKSVSTLVEQSFIESLDFDRLTCLFMNVHLLISSMPCWSCVLPVHPTETSWPVQLTDPLMNNSLVWLEWNETELNGNHKSDPSPSKGCFDGLSSVGLGRFQATLGLNSNVMFWKWTKRQGNASYLAVYTTDGPTSTGPV